MTHNIFTTTQLYRPLLIVCTLTGLILTGVGAGLSLPFLIIPGVLLIGVGAISYMFQGTRR
jgi:hypothetical protein